jgi:hypothetical protein
MSSIKYILPFIFLPLLACGKKSENKTQDKMNDQLLEHVRLAINPSFKNWVVFEHGTYIVFDHVDTIPDIEKTAIQLMAEYGPVSAGGPAGDFTVLGLTQTEGWSISGHCYGMYTYVHPSELKTEKPSDVEVGVYGRSKRDKDGKNPKVIHVNKGE